MQHNQIPLSNRTKMTVQMSLLKEANILLLKKGVEENRINETTVTKIRRIKFTIRILLERGTKHMVIKEIGIQIEATQIIEMVQ